MTLLLLNAMDTLFFRDGKPFSMGYETWANGIFPPPLSVIYGALRTVYYSDNIVELNNANTDNDKSSELKIDFFALYDEDKYYFPCPLDIVEKKGRKDKKVVEYIMLSFHEKPNNYYSSFDLPYLIQTEDQVQEGSGLISKTSLNEYLLENKIPASLRNKYLMDEPKIGIGINSITNSSDYGMLYRVGMKRLENIGIAIGYSGMTISSYGIMRLGGEGKSVSFKTEEDVPDIKMPETLSGDYFKVYLATPAIFNDGWHPAQEKVFGAKLVGAAVGKPIYLGGFDMKPKDGKAGRPKPMRRAVPAGSVFYYKGTRQCAKEIHATSISDYGSEKGFGIAYVGDVKNVNGQ